MFLLEHDAKSLLALHGAPAPAGALFTGAVARDAQLPPPPWVVKAQIAAGGRRKAGLIRTASSRDELQAHLHAILGATHKGMTAQRFTKPVFALIAGRSSPEGVTMGHAGAIVHGSHSGYAAKKSALESAGATAFGSLDEMTNAIAAWHAARSTV